MINHLLGVANSRNLRVICGRVDVAAGTPSAAVGDGYTVVDTAAGQVQVVFDKPGKSIQCALAIPIETTDATGHFVKVDAKAEATSVTFSTYVADATDGALADNIPFYFLVILKDAA